MSTVAVTSRSFSKHPKLRAALLERYPNVSFNDSGKTLSGEALHTFLQGHEKAILGLEILDAELLTRLPHLKVISRFGVGVDTLDLETMKKLGIKLSFTAGANKRAVTELVIAFAILMLRQIPHLHRRLHGGEWLQNMGRQLSGKTVGIIGLGSIGKDLSQVLKIFDCNILAYDLVDQSDYCNQHQIRFIDLEALLKNADIVSLHTPLTKETRNLLNADRFSLMKVTAILINVARGGLVDEEILKQWLIANKGAAAAFDVFKNEPLADNELLSLPNFFATPHIGGSTEEAIVMMGKAAIDGLENAQFVT